VEADPTYFRKVMPTIENIFKTICQNGAAAALPAGSTSTAVLSFSARDLLARMVRANAAIRGNPTNPGEPLRFHSGGCLEGALEIADVHELLQAGLIKYQSEGCQSGQNLYRASEEGKRIAGPEAIADAAKSAAAY
jgi:hypothetical protein